MPAAAESTLSRSFSLPFDLLQMYLPAPQDQKAPVFCATKNDLTAPEYLPSRHNQASLALAPDTACAVLRIAHYRQNFQLKVHSSEVKTGSADAATLHRISIAIIKVYSAQSSNINVIAYCICPASKQAALRWCCSGVLLITLSPLFITLIRMLQVMLAWHSAAGADHPHLGPTSITSQPKVDCIRHYSHQSPGLSERQLPHRHMLLGTHAWHVAAGAHSPFQAQQDAAVGTLQPCS